VTPNPEVECPCRCLPLRNSHPFNASSSSFVCLFVIPLMVRSCHISSEFRLLIWLLALASWNRRIFFLYWPVLFLLYKSGPLVRRFTQGYLKLSRRRMLTSAFHSFSFPFLLFTPLRSAHNDPYRHQPFYGFIAKSEVSVPLPVFFLSFLSPVIFLLNRPSSALRCFRCEVVVFSFSSLESILFVAHLTLPSVLLVVLTHDFVF